MREIMSLPATQHPFVFIDSLADITDRYDTFIVDLWGVIHDGHKPLEGVLHALRALALMDKTVVFLSNAPRRSRPLEDQLSRMGVERDLYTRVYSSGEDAMGALTQEHRGKVCYAIMASIHEPLLEDAGARVTQTLEEADFVLNTGPIPLFVEEHEGLLKEAVAKDLPMVCVNPDIAVMREGVYSLCAGALAKRYEEMGGRVHYHGKPYPEIYERLWDLLGTPDKSRILAVGDSLTTDIYGANGFGVDSLLVLSGLEGYAMHMQDKPFPNREKIEITCAAKHAFPTYVARGFIYGEA